jgi:hypothetical protein
MLTWVQDTDVVRLADDFENSRQVGDAASARLI